MTQLCSLDKGTIPCAYCAGNPVSLVDPTGMDWYISSSGQYKWFPTNVSEYEEDGITYSRIGSGISVLQEDGSYLNYYQNLQVGDATTEPVNALDLILNDPSLTGSLLYPDRKSFCETVL